MLPEGKPFSSVPQNNLDALESLQFWKTVELAPGIIGVNPKAAEKEIQERGFHVFKTE